MTFCWHLTTIEMSENPQERHYENQKVCVYKCSSLSGGNYSTHAGSYPLCFFSLFDFSNMSFRSRLDNRYHTSALKAVFLFHNYGYI